MKNPKGKPMSKRTLRVACPPKSGPGRLRVLAHSDLEQEERMSRKRYTPEQIISMLLGLQWLELVRLIS